MLKCQQLMITKKTQNKTNKKKKKKKTFSKLYWLGSDPTPLSKSSGPLHGLNLSGFDFSEIILIIVIWQVYVSFIVIWQVYVSFIVIWQVYVSCVAGSSIEMVPVYQSRAQLTNSVGKVLAERAIYLCKYKCHLH